MSAPPLERVTRRLTWESAEARDVEALLAREWIVTNGLGGYSSGTLAGVITRRYHGLLVASLANPLGRMVMLNHLVECVRLPDGREEALSGEEWAEGRLDASGAQRLVEFRLEAGLPVWEYAIPAGAATVRVQKRVLMPHRQNTVHVSYALLDGADSVGLTLRPALHFRGYEDPVTTPEEARYLLGVADGHFVVTTEGAATLPALRLAVHGAAATCRVEDTRTNELLYRVEAARGYEYTGVLWSPGAFDVTLARGETATLVASTEPPEVLAALSPADARAAEEERRRRLLDSARLADDDVTAAELVLAADQFLITPAGRLRDRVRAQAVGDEVRTVIAGYHWFTDWGRDTMIALEGLTLSTGRWREAGFILRTFAQYVRDGLIPNMFPDGSNEGLYHTADATLWFFHAVDRYHRVTGDDATLRRLLPVLVDVAERHLRGTRYGIRVDPADGLLTQGAEGYQLTWMDAKMGDWIPTPRRGKAVELNALWHNALCLLAAWTGDARWRDEAARQRASFNRRFWYEGGGHLYDVVDGPDGDSAELRPNQLLAVALPHPVVEQSRWASVVAVAERTLVTPMGLRSLAPGSPEYKAQYFGDLRARDGAYHQGTVWGWLIGPWVDAWLRVHPGDRAGARRWLSGLVGHLDDFGVGSVAEIFDAEAPFTPRGCVAQAWSVAELLRCWRMTDEGASSVER
ncbi:amylo-alpha-1,6-glucosidase [Roseisolibacter sp. H3M3-2]|uniref:amylo-alpha-1,6-glucosidase n=1 Tax=Roseisolibacter sp. H3M3-2 TaxID=3031323 RepID=UPI0023DB0A25|nr:amylo-alpha-1,6-glucosidase [Roseisolibacter sp. H3M3-2]MDF1504168.1 amylo-alpha-1,6-glucosidase [Roseisolibacter sp. H3M3-2]